MQLHAVFPQKGQTVQRVETKHVGEKPPMFVPVEWDPMHVCAGGLTPSISLFLAIVQSSPPLTFPLQVLGVDDAGTGILTGLQLHRGDEPAAGAARVVAERSAVGALGVFGVNDGGAPVANGFLPRLQVHLGLVAPPGAVPHRHHRLAVGGGRWKRGAVHLVPEVSVRVVLDL